MSTSLLTSVYNILLSGLLITMAGFLIPMESAAAAELRTSFTGTDADCKRAKQMTKQCVATQLPKLAITGTFIIILLITRN